MSRIGKKPIEIPQGVDVKIDGRNVIVKGPKGQLSQTIAGRDILVEKKDNFLKHPLVWLVWKLWLFVRKQEKNITSEREIYEKFSLFYSIDREN